MKSKFERRTLVKANGKLYIITYYRDRTYDVKELRIDE